MLANFAKDRVNAKTYWDFYPDARFDMSNLDILEETTLDLMEDAKEIHFNLDGMEDDLNEIYRLGDEEGLLPDNITRWEFATIINEGYVGKTTFYRGGKKVELPSALREP